MSKCSIHRQMTCMPAALDLWKRCGPYSFRTALPVCDDPTAAEYRFFIRIGLIESVAFWCSRIRRAEHERLCQFVTPGTKQNRYRSFDLTFRTKCANSIAGSLGRGKWAVSAVS